MAQLGQKPHGFKDLDFLMVLGLAAVPAIPIRAATVRSCEIMRLARESARESACPTTSKSFACIGGTGFSLSTPARGRIFSHLLRSGCRLTTTPLRFAN